MKGALVGLSRGRRLPSCRTRLVLTWDKLIGVLGHNQEALVDLFRGRCLAFLPPRYIGASDDRGRCRTGPC